MREPLTRALELLARLSVKDYRCPHCRTSLSALFSNAHARGTEPQNVFRMYCTGFLIRFGCGRRRLVHVREHLPHAETTRSIPASATVSSSGTASWLLSHWPAPIRTGARDARGHGSPGSSPRFHVGLEVRKEYSEPLHHRVELRLWSRSHRVQEPHGLRCSPAKYAASPRKSVWPGVIIRESLFPVAGSSHGQSSSCSKRGSASHGCFRPAPSHFPHRPSRCGRPA